MGADITTTITDIVLYLSLVSTTVVITYFLLKPKKRLGYVGSRYIFSVILSGFLYAAGYVINNLTYHQSCPVFAVMFVFGTHAVGTWSCAIAAHIYLVANMRALPAEKYFHIVAWLIPFLCTVIPLCAGLIGKQETGYCYVATAYLIPVMYVPMVLCFLVNTTLLGITIFQLQRSKRTLSEYKNANANQIKLFMIQVNFSSYIIACGLALAVFNTNLVGISGIIASIQPFVNVVISQNGRIRKLCKFIKRKIKNNNNNESKPNTDSSESDIDAKTVTVV